MVKREFLKFSFKNSSFNSKIHHPYRPEEFGRSWHRASMILGNLGSLTLTLGFPG